MAKVSIIVPIHNPGKYLSILLESIIHQTFTDIEILLIDDGSYDGSQDIMKKYANQDKRIKIFFREKQSFEHFGQKYSFDLGYKEATSNYIMVVDHDDELVLNAIELLYNVVQQYPNVDVVQGQSGTKVNDKDIFWMDFKPWNEQKNIFSINDLNAEEIIRHLIFPIPALWACLIRKDFIKNLELGDFISNDTDFVWKMKILANNYCYIPDYIYIHTSHDNSLSGKNNINKTEFSVFEAFYSLEKFLKENNANFNMWQIFALYKQYVLFMHYQGYYLTPERQLTFKNKISEEIKRDVDILTFPISLGKEFENFYLELKKYYSDLYTY